MQDCSIPYKEGKKFLVQEKIDFLRAERGSALVRVYTDEEKDLPLFDLADECFGVNPDSIIEEAAKLRGGKILIFE